MVNTTVNQSQRRPRPYVAVFACIAILALVVDQVTKYCAEHWLSSRESIRVIPGVLSLTLVHNPGASLGMGSNMTWLISLLALIACIVLLVLAWRTTSLWWTLCFAFAFAGAFGNLIDRVLYADGFLNGKVIDFLDYGWSVGNVADIYLMLAGIGMVLLILCNVPFQESRKHSSDSDARKESHA